MRYERSGMAKIVPRTVNYRSLVIVISDACTDTGFWVSTKWYEHLLRLLFEIGKWIVDQTEVLLVSFPFLCLLPNRATPPYCHFQNMDPKRSIFLTWTAGYG